MTWKRILQLIAAYQVHDMTRFTILLAATLTGIFIGMAWSLPHEGWYMLGIACCFVGDGVGRWLGGLAAGFIAKQRGRR
jgi:uncharacterized ion transporter superfamily protein YfcC